MLSTGLQFAAAFVAIHISRRIRSWPFWLLAPAVLLMGVRRAFLLYRHWTFERSIDLGPEIIALSISVLMLWGLIGLYRWVALSGSGADPGQSPPGGGDAGGLVLPRLAILSLGSAMLASGVTGYLAFRASREATHDTGLQSRLDVARAMAAHADALTTVTSHASAVDAIQDLWQKFSHPFPNSYVCVVHASGELLLHTLRTQAVGTDVGDLSVETGREEGPQTLRALVSAGEDWVGDFTSQTGELQVAACAYISRLNSMVMIHIPTEEIDAALRSSVVPWAGGLAFVVLLLIPLPLGLLYRAHLGVMRQCHVATAALRTSEERYQLAERAVHDGLWDWNILTDEDYLSPRWKEILGYGDDELPNVASSFFDLVHADDRATVDEAIRRHLEEGRHYAVEFRLRHRDGSNRWVLSRGEAQRDGTGRPIRMVGSIYDITNRKQVETELQTLTEHLDAILLNLPVGVAILEGPDFRYSRINHALSEINGLPIEAHLGRPLEEILPDAAPDIVPELRQVLEMGVASPRREFTAKLPKDPQEVRHFSNAFFPIFGEEGKPRAVGAVVVDITDHKRAEEALKRAHDKLEQRVADRTIELADSNRKLQEEIEAHEEASQQLELAGKIMENMAGGVCLVRAADGCLGYTNPRFDEIFGYETGELVGLHAAVLNAPGERTPQETAAEILHALEENGIWSGDVHNVRKDETPFWTHASVSTFQHPQHGTVRVAVVEDITERKKMERVLADSEARLRQVLESAPDAMVIVGGAGKIVMTNAQLVSMFGYPQEELLGQAVEMLMPARLRDGHRTHRRAYSEAPALRPMGIRADLWGLRKDGSEFPVEISLGPIEGGEGKGLVVSAIRDITARKRAEEELMTYQQELRSLASALAVAEEKTRREIAAALHDNIAQDIVSCKLVLDAANHDALPEALREKLALVRETLGQVAMATQDLTFDLASPTLYKLGLAPAIREWLRDQVEAKHGIACHYEFEGDMGDLSDESKAFVFRAVKEAGYNTIKHARAKTLTVGLAARDLSVQVTISDDGVGFQDNAHSRRSLTGTGLGLFSIREHVEHLGGDFDIESVPGKGTRLKFTVPMRC